MVLHGENLWRNLITIEAASDYQNGPDIIGPLIYFKVNLGRQIRTKIIGCSPTALDLTKSYVLPDSFLSM